MSDGVGARESGPTAINTSAQQDQTEEDWHGWMALGSAGTLALGIISIVNSANNGAAGLLVLGILLIAAALAGTVVSRFWTTYDRLPAWWMKALATVGYFPGIAVGIIFLWMMKTIFWIAQAFL
jgi:hypothetical protein